MSNTGTCNKCNTENEYSEQFCSMCGERLPWAMQRAVTPQAPTQPSPSTTNKDNAALKEMANISIEKERNDGVNSGCFIGILFGLFLPVIPFGIILALIPSPITVLVWIIATIWFTIWLTKKLTNDANKKAQEKIGRIQ